MNEDKNHISVEDQIMHEIMEVISRYSQEADVKVSTMIGILELAKLKIYQ